MKFSLVAPPIALLMCSSLANAQAPTQTIQGATTFISQVLSNGSVTVAVQIGGYWNKKLTEYTYDGPRNPKTVYSDGGANIILSAKIIGECTISISTNTIGTTSSSNKVADKYTSQENVEQAIFDFRKLAEAKQDGTNVYLKGLRYEYRLEIPAESLASRVAYAMEFLRTRCDPTAATGF